MSASDRYVETNGIRLHYLDHAGGGPTLVLAPGLTANAHSFGGLMRAGLGDVAHVLALDLRGRGESDAPPTGYAMEDHARDVIGLLDALELDRVVMGGHSFGGLLTYWLAANHPERVERCVVLDAPAGGRPTIMEQIQPSLQRLGHVYPSWDEYVALVRGRCRTSPKAAGTPMSRATSAPTRSSLPDGTVQARCRPEHISEVDRGEIRVRRLAGARASRSRSRPCSSVLPAASGRPGSPPLLSREDAEATAALMADGTVVDGVGNHITFVFGAGAQVLTGAIAAFLAGEPS